MQQNENSQNNIINGHEYVDLGLSVKWATCNLGAVCPSDCGDYYAWGEILPKAEYTEENSETYGEGMRDIASDPQFDAARKNWGEPWRLPTKDEMDELSQKCKHSFTRQKGHPGYLVFGPNGNSIFLPVTGYRLGTLLYNAWEGHYWSSTPLENDGDCACSLVFDGDHFAYDGVLWYRENGFSIRPVAE